MATIQSAPSAIELADAAQKRLFVVSVVFGVIAALIAASLAWLVWQANDKYQDAVKTDADARIATADSRSAQANAEAAKANEGLGKSNEEIARLTKEAEQAKTERAEADKQIAVAKADALRAKEGIANAEAASAKASVEVARLQVVIANAEQKRAEAEKALLELQERHKPRHLTAEQRATLIKLSKSGPKGKVSVYVFIGDNEAIAFSAELIEALSAAGWEVKHEGQHVALFTSGLGILVRSPDKAPAYAGFLQNVLKGAQLEARGVITDQVQEGTVALFVGPKP